MYKSDVGVYGFKLTEDDVINAHNSVLCCRVQPVQAHNRQVCILQEPRNAIFMHR